MPLSFSLLFQKSLVLNEKIFKKKKKKYIFKGGKKLWILKNAL